MLLSPITHSSSARGSVSPHVHTSSARGSVSPRVHTVSARGRLSTPPQVDLHISPRLSLLRLSSVPSPYSWALRQGCSVRSCSSLWTCHPKHIYKTPIILYSTLFTHYIYLLAILLIQSLITILISTLLSTKTLSYIQLQLNSR